MARNTPASRASALRRKARRAAEKAAALDALRATGAQCGNCKHFEPKGLDGAVEGPWCSFHSDWPWYQPAKPEELCTSYRPKPVAPCAAAA